MRRSTLIAAALLLSSVSLAPAQNMAVNSQDVYWVATLDIPPGHMDGFKKAIAGLTELTKNEPGTLEYVYLVSDDQKTVEIWERYKDSDAVMYHLTKTFPQHSKEFLENSKITKVVVYGNPNEEVKKAMSQFNPVYFKPIEGFARN